MDISKCWGQLLGVTVYNMYVSEGEGVIAFCTQKAYSGRGYSHEAKHLIIETNGDCCSETWFADIVGRDNLIPNEIIGVRFLSVPSVEDNRSRQDVDDFYGVRLSTSKGDCDIIYRNSSNGYYGGSSSLSKVEFSSLIWKEITEDTWQA